jgi:hypothetical protein
MIIDRIPTSDGPYQLDGYQYRVEMDLRVQVDMMPWIKETGFKCSTWNDVISTVVYIKNEQDLVFFMLRWS